MLITAVAVKITSPGPIIFKQRRLGLNGKEFDINKFRSMIKDTDKIGGATTLNDSRITKVGAVLCKANLDEIAQLINVLNGAFV